MCYGLGRVVIFACTLTVTGRLAQMVERPLRMREVGGSIPPMSNLLLLLLLLHFLLSRCHTRPRRETLYTQPTTDKTTTKQKHYIHIYLHVNSSDIYLSMDTDGLEVSNQQAASLPAARLRRPGPEGGRPREAGFLGPQSVFFLRSNAIRRVLSPAASLPSLARSTPVGAFSGGCEEGCLSRRVPTRAAARSLAWPRRTRPTDPIDRFSRFRLFVRVCAV